MNSEGRCFLLLLALALSGTSAQTAEKKVVPTISVAKTESSGVASWQPAMGEGLAQMIITELSSLPNFKVLESVALDDLRAERALGESGEVSQAESVKKGQWKGADYTFKSTITRFGSKENNFGGGGLLVEGKEIWISLGANNGFAKGDKVKIYKPIEKKNKKGEVVAMTYEPAAEIILLKVQKDKSMGEYAGTAQISEDWAVTDAAVDIEKLDGSREPRSHRMQGRW